MLLLRGRFFVREPSKIGVSVGAFFSLAPAFPVGGTLPGGVPFP